MNLNEIALKRLHILTVPGEGPISAEARIVGLGDLANLGYRVTNPQAWNDSVFTDWQLSTIPTLTALRGGDVAYAPLFEGFPDFIPDHKNIRIDDALYITRRVVPESYFALLLESLGEDATRWLRVSSIPQDPKRTAKELERQDNKHTDTHTEWIDLTLKPAAEVEAALLMWLRDLLYAPTSMKDAEADDVLQLLVHFGLGVIDMDEVTFLETRSLLLQIMWQANAFDELQLAEPEPTELLRLFARLTGTDVSLMKTVRFPRMSKKQRRTVLACIEQSTNTIEDLFRYRNLWLRVAEYLHPGQYSARYPRTHEAFTRLRNNRRNPDSFEAQVEQLVAAPASQQTELLMLLSQRPTLFARRLRRLLVDAGQQGAPAVLDAFAPVADVIPPKALMTLYTHLATVEAQAERAVINRRGGVHIVPSPPPLAPEVTSSTLELLDGAIDAALAKSPSWAGQKAWIDPALADYVAPLQQRKISDGMLNLARGSRLPLDLDNILRLFVYWQQPPGQTSDLDLSAVTFDKDLNYVGHVDWTRLQGRGITHSGDITSAPVGAAEFIDIKLGSLGRNVHYVAPQIYRYAGPAFPELVRAHSGWMIRSKAGSHDGSKAFDISTVQNVFDLSGRNAFAVPFLADVHSGQIIYTDLYVGRRQMNNQVSQHENTVAEICQAVRHFTTNRLTLHDLAHRNVSARGAELVSDRADATLTFGVDDECLFSAQDVAAINAHLLG